MAKITTRADVQERLRKNNQLDKHVAAASMILNRAKEFPVIIAYSTLRVPYAIHDEFKAAIRKAGWTVRFISDQRDGDFWKFS